jgi:hypothetical protein
MEKLPPTNDPRCGTRNGYQGHSSRNERPCDPCRVANSARFRRWYATAAENERQRFKKNKERLEYREQRITHAHKRRAQKLLTAHEKYTVQEVLSTWGTDCHLCGEPVDLTAPRQVGVEGWEMGLHLDHVIDLVLGGTDTLTNVKPSHGRCNLSKVRSVLVEKS